MSTALDLDALADLLHRSLHGTLTLLGEAAALAVVGVAGDIAAHLATLDPEFDAPAWWERAAHMPAEEGRLVLDRLAEARTEHATLAALDHEVEAFIAEGGTAP